MNLDAQAALDAQRQRDLDRRDDQNHARLTGEHRQKLVITQLWRGDVLYAETQKSFPYVGRWAVCPNCGAGPPSEVLLAFFPERIEERAGEECDLYLHQCEEESR